jgi:hypothetical protein
VIGPPVAVKSQIPIAQRARQRDMADLRHAVEIRRSGFQARQRARHLAGLMVEPFRLVPVRAAPAALVNLQYRCIHQTVAQRLQRQRREAGGRVSRNDPAAAGAMIEIFDDHLRVEERRSILEDQDRNLAERILPAQRIGRLHRVGPARWRCRSPGQAGPPQA